MPSAPADKPPPSSSPNTTTTTGAPDTTHKNALLTVAVSSRALFDFETENKIFSEKGDKAYMAHQRELLDNVAAKGVAFPLVKKLLAFNRYSDEDRALVDIIILSRNDPVTGLRVFRSISEYELDISRGCFTRGQSSLHYLNAFNAQLFLSALAEDVSLAVQHGCAAAHVMGGATAQQNTDDTLRIAFDGDAVLFGEESEQVYQQKGLEPFIKQEATLARSPMQPGPLKPFFEALCQIKNKTPAGAIRTALVTSRGKPAHERPIRTLMDWGLDIDEVFFMSGMKKENILKAFRPDFYFDDQVQHLSGIDSSGHVPMPVTNS